MSKILAVTLMTSAIALTVVDLRTQTADQRSAFPPAAPSLHRPIVAPRANGTTIRVIPANNCDRRPGA